MAYDNYGPRAEFAQRIHATKYRAPDETFDDYAVRWSRATTDNDKDFRRALRYTRDEALLPAGRQQHSMGRPYMTTAYNCFTGSTIDDSLGGIMDELKRAALTLRTGSMTGVKRRLIAHIEIAQRAERRQAADVDKRIVWHRRPLLLGFVSALVPRDGRGKGGSAFQLSQDW